MTSRKRQRNSSKCRLLCMSEHMKQDKLGHFMACHVCGARIDPVRKPGSWIADHHPIPFANDGPDTPENLAPLCIGCAPEKNSDDWSEISHGKRMGARHFGVKQSKGWRR